LKRKTGTFRTSGKVPASVDSRFVDVLSVAAVRFGDVVVEFNVLQIHVTQDTVYGAYHTTHDTVDHLRFVSEDGFHILAPQADNDGLADGLQGR
jgi:hypothetical protein